jgi:F0F1-type ATP synthase delta subunit
MDNFLNKLTNKNKKEQKYLAKLLKRETLDNEEKKEILFFLNSKTYEELQNFLKNQSFIDYDLTPEDFELSFNELKEKIAYEIIESILSDS